jgi:hypothetical protein
MSTCFHPRCERTIAATQLACKPHWFELSSGLRKRIWTAWRHRQQTNDAGPHRNAMLDALQEWKAKL